MQNFRNTPEDGWSTPSGVHDTAAIENAFSAATGGRSAAAEANFIMTRD